MILENGVVRTLDPSLPAGRALAIAGAFVAGGVGVHETALASPDVVNLGGRCVLPAFTDSHVHFPTWSLAQRQVKLDGCASIEEALARVREAEVAPGRWLRGYGWRDGDWQPQVEPTKEMLDEVTGDTPTILISKDYHSALAQLGGARRRRRRPRRPRRRRRARRGGRADGDPARRVGLALPRPLRAHDRGGVGRGDTRRAQARQLTRGGCDPRQGRLARRAGDLPAPPRRGEPLAARLGIDPARATRCERERSRSARASATSTCASAT